jgi:hypothetical protein
MDPVTAVTAAVAATAATAPTFADAEVIGQIIEMSKGAKGSAVAIIAVIVNVLVTLLRNADKLILFKLTKVDVLINKIPKDVFPIVVTGLATVGSILVGIAGGGDIGSALVNGLAGGLSAIGINEAIKPIKKKANLK